MLQFAKNTRHVFFHEFCCQRCARIPSSRGTEFAHRNVHRFKKPVHNERTSTDQTRHLAASYQLAAYIILKLLTSALRLYYLKNCIMIGWFIWTSSIMLLLLIICMILLWNVCEKNVKNHVVMISILVIFGNLKAYVKPSKIWESFARRTGRVFEKQKKRSRKKFCYFMLTFSL